MLGNEPAALIQPERSRASQVLDVPNEAGFEEEVKVRQRFLQLSVILPYL